MSIGCSDFMVKYEDFRKYAGWQKSMDLAEAVYTATAHFPAHERYSLVQQLRRAAVSISSNIAEGSGRESSKDFARFLSYSMGSATEVESQTILATRLGYMSPTQEADILELLGHTRRLVRGLHRSIVTQHSPN